MEFTWQWITSQVFAFIGLIFVVISFQQKSTKKLLILRNISTIFVIIGHCFLGNPSAIIFSSVGELRNLMTLYFAIKPETKKIIKYIGASFIVLLLIVLNVIFWKDFYNLYSILLGTFAVITFMQKKASTIRKFSVVAEIAAIVYYSLLVSPTNVLIEVMGLISIIIGIIRLDLKKQDDQE